MTALCAMSSWLSSKTQIVKCAKFSIKVVMKIQGPIEVIARSGSLVSLYFLSRSTWLIKPCNEIIQGLRLLSTIKQYCWVFILTRGKYKSLFILSCLINLIFLLKHRYCYTSLSYLMAELCPSIAITSLKHFCILSIVPQIHHNFHKLTILNNAFCYS